MHKEDLGWVFTIVQRIYYLETTRLMKGWGEPQG
jgi:hypothetical protein